MQPIEVVEARLTRLERECRRWRRVAVGASVLGVAALMVGGAAGGPVTKSVTAEEFVLVDRNGRRTAYLGSFNRETGTILRFLGERGEQLDVGLDLGNPIVRLAGPGRTAAVMLGVGSKSTGTVFVRGEDGTMTPLAPATQPKRRNE